MTNRQVDPLLNPFGEDAGGCWIGLQVTPAVLKPSGIIVAEGDGLVQAVAVQGRQHPHLDHQLKAVAYPQHQLAGIDKTGELFHQLLTAATD